MGWPPRWIVGASASVIFPCSIKSRRWRAVMEEVDKGCSNFSIIVDTAGILIHSQLKALAVNLSQPSGRLWLYAGLIGSNNPRWLKADLVVCVNPSSSWVGECLFWYRLTWVVPDKGQLSGCVCVCVLLFQSYARFGHITQKRTCDNIGSRFSTSHMPSVAEWLACWTQVQ